MARKRKFQSSMHELGLIMQIVNEKDILEDEEDAT